MVYCSHRSKPRKWRLDDYFHIIAFYLIEGTFILVVIPFLVIFVLFLPIGIYYAFSGQVIHQWPFYLAGFIIASLQIISIRLLFRRFVLKPKNMSLGQWLRWKFHPSEILKRKAQKNRKEEQMELFYDIIDGVLEEQEIIEKKSSQKLRKELVKKTSKETFQIDDIR